jgi:non-ribosomal peptide synthetase component F
MALLAQLRSAGLRLSSRGDQLLVEPKAALTGELRAVIRDNKALILRELAENSPPSFTPAQEAARQDVLSRLAVHPDVMRAFNTRFEHESMIVALAVRGVGTCELAIPIERFNPANLDDYAALLACLNAGPQEASM